MRRHWPRIPMPTSSECGGVRTTEPPTWRTVGAHAYERAEDMFADVDAVAFAVRRTFRRSSRSGPRPRGCHLLMDKPVAFTSQDAERVVEAVDRAGVRSLVFLTSRFELRLRPHVRLDLRAGRQLGWQPIIVIVPTLIIFLLLQRFIYNGLSAAATK